MNSEFNASENFRAALAKAGITYEGEIIADGKLHRFKAVDDQHRNSWFIFFQASSGTPAAGAFGCWKRGVKETWCEKSRESFTPAEGRSIRKRWKLADDERKQMEAERHAKARKMAAWIFKRATTTESHPYLKRKGVKTFGDVREYRGAMSLPLRDVSGELHSL